MPHVLWVTQPLICDLDNKLGRAPEVTGGKFLYKVVNEKGDAIRLG